VDTGVGGRALIPEGAFVWPILGGGYPNPCLSGYLSEGRASDVLLEGAKVFHRIGTGQITDVLGIVGGCDGQVLS
jgi:hypothetical protein